MPPPTTETTIAVRSGEIDSFGHVNHAVFLHYFEHARFEALQAAGFRWQLLRENDWQIYVVRIEVDYVAQAMRGDVLRVRTWAEGFRRTSMTLVQGNQDWDWGRPYETEYLPRGGGSPGAVAVAAPTACARAG